ncbi:MULTISPECIES: BTAD domain-containing putative transcriptional regulator [unclassified Streptomyces]|uniref:BTAD domain-containing putative transcriptional regulator n=1 Tax=unclassified Streptomyces TaxID=2593676 RepID=UPI000CD5558B|nr:MULTISPECIES: BTAD domain-containing putative transcriptional regulator [unclassified Streptomyces]
MARTTHSGSGNRSPVPVKVGRSFGDVMKAIGAFLALATLVVGVPLSLAYFIGWPLPSEAPSLEMLSQEISTSVFLKVLGVLVWIAWAQFTACVLVEVKAAVSGVGMPTRVPGAGPSQLLARQLVGALLLLGTAAASFTPGLSAIGQGFDGGSQHSVVAEAEQTPGQERAERAAGPSEAEPAVVLPEADASQGAEEDADATKFYRIQPPDGRHHDTLWGISERHLGDGLRYKEIFQLNKDRVQPDGSRLTEASLIRPGWILEMPADAEGGDLVEIPHDMEELSEEEVEEIQEYGGTGGADAADPASSPDAAPGGGGVQNPGGMEVGPEPGADIVPERTEQAFDTGDGGATGTAEMPNGPGSDISEVAEEDAGFGLSDALMAAPLLAAGLLGALGRTRRNALWQAAAGTLRRSVGDDLEPHDDAGTDVRDALLAGADPAAVAFLDRALRRLSADLDAAGRSLPSVYAAWLSDTEIHLQLAAPAGTPPAPWQLGQSESYWTLERDRLDASGGEEPDAEAPYPGLVSLGTRDSIRLLLNLEAVPGIVSVLGAPSDREAVLSSIAAELATSGWADRMTVTLVGFGADLTVLAPTRVRHLDDISGLLEVMETETSLRHSNLQHTGQDSVLTGRTGPARQHQWAPHLVVVGVEPTEDEAERLGGLASVSAPLGIGYLVTSDRPDLPGLAWEFEITEDGELKEPDMGLELVAQLLPAAQRAGVVKLFSALGEAGAEGGAGFADPAFLVELGSSGKPEVYAELMGGWTLTGLETPEAERAVQLREALALLLLHRAGVHPRVLATALWPRGVSDDVRDAFVGRLGEWLGTETVSGRPRLHVDADGRLALSSRVVSDWDVLRTLHHQTIAAPRPGLPAADRKRKLTDALSLAQGPLLDGQRDGGRYGWLRHEIVDAQYPLLVGEVALTLAREHLKAGEGEPAYLAVRSALGAAPTDERLWNELLRAAHATGRPEWLSGAAQWLVAHHQQLFGADRPLPAETEALLDELLPSWRQQTPVA